MAPMIAPAAIVDAPARTPNAFGLGSVIAWRENQDRFESGVRWESLGCGPLRGRARALCPPDVVAGLPKPLEDFDAPDWTGEALPFVVYGDFLCNPLGGGFDRAQDFATSRLRAGEEARVEQAFWSGDLGSTPNLSGANGFDAPDAVGAYTEPKFALAALEFEMGAAYGGSQGVLHMSRRTASLLGGALIVTGGRLTTRLGTPVVAGAGYPDELVIVGTPALIGWRSEIITSSNVRGDLLDRKTNEMYAIAERVYEIGFDPCPVLSATYTENGETP